ncbi:MAG: glycosyltransferase family 39 protein [Candidatus Andersenbacteria bacterium]|nr:glycosyltransferase family 39 protein [Candidatus Andersenbacteria bacterium]MBI3250244.1 glycosyltransferase family 39 protein [Candidatus Andersenbacteria bacterium]
MPISTFSYRLRILIVAFVLLALTTAFRLYNLSYSNNFATDEGNNGYLALRILRDHVFIFRGVTAHFGAVAHYITAGFFALFGPSVFVARLTPALASVAASLVLFIWLKKLAGIRGAITGLLIALFSSWMVNWSRVTWEMGPNVLFIVLAAFALYQYMRSHRWWLAGLSGLFLGLAANGHLYIIVQTIPYGLAILLTKTTWKEKLLATLSALAGGLMALAPFLYASWLKGWDLFSNYAGSGGNDNPESFQDAIVRMVGIVATLFHTLHGPLAILFLVALLWAMWQGLRRHNELARFLVMSVVAAALTMPFIVAATQSVALDAGWCGTVSKWLGSDRCVATNERYFDLIYPLPILLSAWFLTRLTRKSVTTYLLLSTLVIAPLVPYTLRSVSTVSKERLEYLEPALDKLPRIRALFLIALTETMCAYGLWPDNIVFIRLKIIESSTQLVTIYF